ncbi:5-amino-6-(D-ribitylamino)uracil--L-tyrosine 4-hydroxyphenyl transferase CofH [Xanthobacter autotrophicus DSM 431]|uniref:5-amino-6-(D-ribitylamino)uracil--L-tyrosine 4-hydroxyphenyl transferase CofH n=1 Tax=Xanthobacter nonsaccharivorans TaxID=3119912 RepID=UPI00372B214A
MPPAAFSDRFCLDDLRPYLDLDDPTPLMALAAEKRDRAHGHRVSYSRKVFIPLTQLCRDVCHYCTFAHPPRNGEAAFLTPDEVLRIARAGVAAGCREALFTLGDKPELRYEAARRELASLGHDTTLSYLAAMARLVFEETGLLPHLNPGVMSAQDIAALRPVSVSLGLMLETSAERLSARGGPHFGSPDKLPAVRLATLRAAGEHKVPFTSGLLIGIGETRLERVEALLALREISDAYSHVQEIIIQNFRPKPGTLMAQAKAPSLAELQWTIAAARMLFEPGMNIQAPPNLSAGALAPLLAAGINDWGGLSPVTPDHVNPEAPWPHLRVLEAATRASGKMLVERLAVYPSFAERAATWLDRRMRTAVQRQVDGAGWPRAEDWSVGIPAAAPAALVENLRAPAVARSALAPVLARAEAGATLEEGDIVRLLAARDHDFKAVCASADGLRRAANGDVVSYVVTRNINYTNICTYKCRFCAFSKGKTHEALRGRPYDLTLAEIADRTREAWDRGATEVCMQGGIHPDYTGARYLEILAAVKAAVPAMHAHAFSPLEVHHGATTLGLPVSEFLVALRAAGLGSLPGTAAEILDDEVRATLCPDKLTTQEWLTVMRAAHRVGLKSTATIMFGHMERYEHVARHLLRIRALQEETGGFTEFVPLPFVHMEAPIYLNGGARKGPTAREAILIHAVARLVLNPVVRNIQASWVKLGPNMVSLALDAGVNDFGGTLMDESISRAAGASHGQEMTPERMETMIASAGRIPRRRTTLYGEAPPSPLAPPEPGIALAASCGAGR